MSYKALTVLVVASSILYVRGDPNPLTPGPNDLYFEDQTCLITWEADTTGSWKSMTIDLMTGDNFNMVHLATLGNVDGTDPSRASFSHICPQVSPHSAVYFYQFSTPAAPGNATWTTRFTITDSVKGVVAPPQSMQPDGVKIPWGTGTLVGTDQLNSTSSASTSTSTPAAAFPHATSSASSTEPASIETTSTPTSSATSIPNSATANTAMITTSLPSFLSQTAFALGVFALGFVIMF